jgi:hypothetical protein
MCTYLRSLRVRFSRRPGIRLHLIARTNPIKEQHHSHHHQPSSRSTGKKTNKIRMSFFGIGPSAKLLTVDVTFIHPKRACVVKSYTIGMSGGHLTGDTGATLMHSGGGNIARETLPLITSGA